MPIAVLPPSPPTARRRARRRTHVDGPRTTHPSRWTRNATYLAVTLLCLFALTATLAAQSPWERAALRLQTSFTGPLARSLSLVAIVLGGLMFMFGEGGAKRQISGIVFGGGLALFASQFLTWLF